MIYNFDQIRCLTVNIPFLHHNISLCLQKIEGTAEEFGLISDESVGELVWWFTTDNIKHTKHEVEGLCSFSDKSNGLDICTVTFEVSNWDDVDQLNRTLDWLNVQVKAAVDEVCERYELKA